MAELYPEEAPAEIMEQGTGFWCKNKTKKTCRSSQRISWSRAPNVYIRERASVSEKSTRKRKASDSPWHIRE